MKQFIDNFIPIEIEIKNLKNESYILKTQFMNAEIIKKIEESTKDKKLLASDIVYQMLEKTFGKGEDFFKQFSFNLLGEILKYVAEETKKNSQPENG